MPVLPALPAQWRNGFASLYFLSEDLGALDSQTPIPPSPLSKRGRIIAPLFPGVGGISDRQFCATPIYRYISLWRSSLGRRSPERSQRSVPVSPPRQPALAQVGRPYLACELTPSFSILARKKKICSQNSWLPGTFSSNNSSAGALAVL